MNVQPKVPEPWTCSKFGVDLCSPLPFSRSLIYLIRCFLLFPSDAWDLTRDKGVQEMSTCAILLLWSEVYCTPEERLGYILCCHKPECTFPLQKPSYRDSFRQGGQQGLLVLKPFISGAVSQSGGQRGASAAFKVQFDADMLGHYPFFGSIQVVL